MALADSVPGVSGGTIAFLLGFYDKFIVSLDNLISGDKKEKKESIIFLIKIGTGWVVGFILAVLVLANLFETHIYKVSSLFLGFVLFSIPLICIGEKNVLKGKYRNIVFTIIGAILVVLLSIFNPSADVNVANLTIGSAIYIFITGAIAITAMVLPGISGSTLLLIFGLYLPIIGAIKEILHLNFAYLPSIIVFGIGVIVGVISIIKLVRMCLEKFRSQTIYCILGLMIGSLFSIIQGPTTLDIPKPAMDIHTFSIIFFVLGGVVIFGLQKLKTIMENKKK
jgi:putative membrane protein